MEGILITILMFSVPILAAIIDKRLRAARKAQPQVHAEPIIFEEEEEPEEQEEAPRAIVREPAVPVTAPVMPAPAVKTVQAAPVVKAAPAAPAAPAAHHEDAAPIIRKKAVPESFPTAEEIRGDRRKLILYKEIMTPKFDNE